MKSNWILGILAVLIICSIFCISQGADRFYYGTFSGELYPSALKYSLRFNITTSWAYPNLIDSLASNGLRALVTSPGEIGPTHWAWNSHYTIWEAEGLTGSLYGFSYTGGRLTADGSASGGKAWLFKRWVDQAGLVQLGPRQQAGWGYDQEFRYKLSDTLTTINYTAIFRLKSPDDSPAAMGGRPPDTLCVLKVVSKNSLGDDTLLAQRVVYTSEFKNFLGYNTFPVGEYQLPTPPPNENWRKVEFQIYWSGKRSLFVDYVKVRDRNGNRLLDDTTHAVANNIKAYVSEEWTKTENTEGDTVIYRWYGRDEPHSIDLYRPHVYIDSLLKEVSEERVLFQAYTSFAYPDRVHEYMLRENPKDYCIDPYPTWKFGNNYTGEAYQVAWNDYIDWLESSKTVADSLNKDLWVTLQAHIIASFKPTDVQNCPFETFQYNGRVYCPSFREPTAEELRLQTFLSLCSGANAILHYNYIFTDLCPEPSNCSDSVMFTGLYDNLYEHDTTTYKWREIRDFIGPRVEKLGPVLNQLTWQGICSHDTVGSFVLRNGNPSYIDSIVGIEPESTYVEVGFFEDEWANHYLMLVNRRTLESQQDFVRVYFNLPDGPYIATDKYAEAPIGKFCGFTPLEVGLQPGEGRLFKLEKYHPLYVMYVPSFYYQTIQSAIDASWWWTTILVAPGTYYENLDFKGKNPTVTSYLHLYPNSPVYVDITIIDGSAPSDPVTASVVRFVNNETSQAVLKGFTIRNGKGTVFIDKGEPNPYGGGIYCHNSSPTIINNVIMADSAMYGGGIYCRNSSPQILNNSIKENKADLDGGGIAIETEYQSYSSPILSNNVIVDNVADFQGGGIYYRGDPFIINNTIAGNSGGGVGAGGGIFLNTGIFQHGYIKNNIIANNLRGGGIYGSSGPTVMAYNDVWNNVDGDFGIVGVGDTTWGENRNGTACDSFYNIIQNPGFYNGYHLNEDSACVDAGDNDALYLLPTDFEGNPRVLDYVDMGAYEYQSGSFGGGGAKIASGDTTSGSKSAADVPIAFELSQNFPNPFNPVTSIHFTIGSDQSPAQTTLKIYNMLGQLVRTLVDEEKSEGTYIVYWDGRNQNDKEVSSGIYFYKLESGNFTEVKKMVLLR